MNLVYREINKGTFEHNGVWDDIGEALFSYEYENLYCFLENNLRVVSISCLSEALKLINQGREVRR